MSNPRIFRYFKTSPKIIRLAVMMYVRYPPSLRNVEDLLHERGIDKSPPSRSSGFVQSHSTSSRLPWFCPAAVAQLLEVVLPLNCLRHFTF
jgi:putative transposase